MGDVDQVRNLSRTFAMMTARAIPPNNPSSAHFPDVSAVLYAADRRSLYFLATWRKGGVPRFGAFGGIIGNAGHGRGPCGPPAGFGRCSATSTDRAVHHYLSCAGLAVEITVAQITPPTARPLEGAARFKRQCALPYVQSFPPATVGAAANILASAFFLCA